MAQDVRWPAIGAEGPRPGRQIDARKTTCPRLRTPKPPMRRRWGTACWAWDGLGPWPMGCDATPPPDATANIPAPMVVRLWLLPLPPPTSFLPVSGLDLSSSSPPDIHPRPRHRQRPRLRLPFAVAAPRHRLRLRCSCLSCCAALSFRRPSGDACFSKPGSPVRLATTHIHRTLPDRFCRAPQLSARLLSSRRRTPGSHGWEARTLLIRPPQIFHAVLIWSIPGPEPRGATPEARLVEQEVTSSAGLRFPPNGQQRRSEANGSDHSGIEVAPRCSSSNIRAGTSRVRQGKDEKTTEDEPDGSRRPLVDG